MPVSAYRAAGTGPHTGGKSPASRPGRVKSRETRTVRWREIDSNFSLRARETDVLRLDPAVALGSLGLTNCRAPVDGEVEPGGGDRFRPDDSLGADYDRSREQQICRQYAYGDGAITPAISVLSALEGLDIIFPAFAPYVLPVSVPGTVEERIVELQEKKGRLAAATLDARGAVGSLAAEDLDYLFGE